MIPCLAITAPPPNHILKGEGVIDSDMNILCIHIHIHILYTYIYIYIILYIYIYIIYYICFYILYIHTVAGRNKIDTKSPRHIHILIYVQQPTSHILHRYD